MPSGRQGNPEGRCYTNLVMDSSRESSVVAGLHEQTHTPAYKTRNWPIHIEALKRRGSLTVWFDPVMNWDAAPTGRRERLCRRQEAGAGVQ